MARLKKSTRYYISIERGWFKGQKAFHADDPLLEPPYSSNRIVCTASRFHRVVDSLTAAGFIVEWAERLIFTRKLGKLIRTERRIFKSR